MTTRNDADIEIEVARTRNDVRRQLDLLSEAASDWPPRRGEVSELTRNPRFLALMPQHAHSILGYIRDLERLVREKAAVR